jgi:hypothetical protein
MQLYKHEVTALGEAAASQIFCQAAGLPDSLPLHLREVEAAILNACGGLPLALRLMGGQLYRNVDKASWQVSQLHAPLLQRSVRVLRLHATRQ